MKFWSRNSLPSVFYILCVIHVIVDSRLSKEDDSSARRLHKLLVGRELNDELSTLSEALEDAIKLCNKTYVTPIYKLQELEKTGKIPDENDQNTKCYLYCMLQMMGVMGLEENKFETDQTIVMMAEHLTKDEKDKFRIMADNCGNSMEQQLPCDGAYSYFKCIVAGIKLLNFTSYDMNNN